MEKEKLREFIESRMEGTPYFLVDLTISAANEIRVEIDSDEPVDIDYCVEMTRAIEEAFSRDEEDYELEVGSAGFTSPFKVRRQYDKNIGQEVEVFANDSKKYVGVLRRTDDDGFEIDMRVKVKEEGSKKPVEKIETKRFGYGDVRKVQIVFKF